MKLRHNPVTYLILSNVLLWGLPLSIIQMQAMMAERNVGDVQTAKSRPTAVGASLMSLEPLTQPDPLARFTSLNSNAVATPVALTNTQTQSMLPELQPPAQALNYGDLPMMPPDLLTQLKGADGLGGPVTMASSNEPMIPIAARAERLQWQRSNDSLAALPLHWRDSLRQELGAGVRVSQSSTVRLPVRELPERQEVPVIINDQGVAEGLVEPRHQSTREAVETWAARQQPAEAGTVQVVLVAAEPLPSAQESIPELQ